MDYDSGARQCVRIDIPKAAAVWAQPQRPTASVNGRFLREVGQAQKQESGRSLSVPGFSGRGRFVQSKSLYVPRLMRDESPVGVQPPEPRSGGRPCVVHGAIRRRNRAICVQNLFGEGATFAATLQALTTLCV
jgi:hypothetical protein